MARIFLSYAREDADIAGRLAQLAEARGHSVFWDQRIVPGRRWDEELDQELARAERVVVLWSRHSIGSEWVRLEASEAGDRLLPALIAVVRPPLAFRLRQTVDLNGWEGEADHPGAASLLAALDEPIGSSSPWQRSVQAIAARSPRQAIGVAAQGLLLLFAVVASSLLDVVPVSETSLRWLPGPLAALVAVLFLVPGVAIARGLRWRWRPWWWRSVALVAALLALAILPGYARGFAQGTVEVPIGEALDLERRVIGSEYTDRATRYLALHPELEDDLPGLIQDAGGIEKVWTEKSIEERWWRLTRGFVIGVGSALLALLALAQSVKFGEREL